MRRNSEFDKTKLTQVATNKTVASAYVDAFPIEQVKFRFAEFKNAKEFIDVYLSFEDALRITQDIKSGKLFKDMQKEPYPITLSHGGRNEGEGVVSRSISAGIQINEQDSTKTKVYLNAQKGPGKETETGAVLPAGPPTKKVSVGMSVDAFKGMFLYIEAGINAYMPYLIKDLVRVAEERRQK